MFLCILQVSVTGSSGTYGDLVFTGDVGVTILKSSLCRVVFEQRLAVSQNSDLAARLVAASDDVTSVEIFAHEEVLISSRSVNKVDFLFNRILILSTRSVCIFYAEFCIFRTTAFAVVYRTYGADGVMGSCPVDYPAFIQELRDEHLTGLLTPQGVQLTVVSAVDALAAVSLSSAYSFYLTTSVVVSDVAVLEANLAEKWRATFSGSSAYNEAMKIIKND